MLARLASPAATSARGGRPRAGGLSQLTGQHGREWTFNSGLLAGIQIRTPAVNALRVRVSAVGAFRVRTSSIDGHPGLSPDIDELLGRASERFGFGLLPSPIFRVRVLSIDAFRVLISAIGGRAWSRILTSNRSWARISSIDASRLRAPSIWGVPGAGFGRRHNPGSGFVHRRVPGSAFGHPGPIFTPEWTKAEPGIPRRPKREPAFLRTAGTRDPAFSKVANTRTQAAANN